MRGNLTCFAPASTSVNVTCPIHTAYNGTACAPLCPLPPYSEERYFRRFDFANWVLGSLSILGESSSSFPGRTTASEAATCTQSTPTGWASASSS